MLGSFSGVHSPMARMKNWHRPVTDGPPPLPPVADPFRQYITATTIGNWSTAPSGSFVRVTAQEYAAVTASLGANLVKKGHDDEIINTRISSTTWGLPIVPTTPSTSESLFTFEPGEYLVAFVAETWNRAGTTWLGYMTEFVTGSAQFPVSGAIAFGGGRTYFVRKAKAGLNDPFSPVTQSLIPAVSYSQSPNAVTQSVGRAFRYSSSLSAEPKWVLAPASPKMQVILSSENPWT